MHTRRRLYVYKYIYTYFATFPPRYIHLYLYYVHACKHTQIHIHTYIHNILTYIHTYIHTIHTCTHSDIHIANFVFHDKYFFPGDKNHKKYQTAKKQPISENSRTLLTSHSSLEYELYRFITARFHVQMENMKRNKGKRWGKQWWILEITSEHEENNGEKGRFCAETENMDWMNTHGVVGHNATLEGYSGPGSTWANEMNLFWVMPHMQDRSFDQLPGDYLAVTVPPLLPLHSEHWEK